ncbi:MAG: DUF308 domain-containing protein [Microbacteriaceae bacterium]|jgi:uncharacterized membrane protein HdeD (DUF308 family)|nr:DUF308 domain-containing protein [Microbacteriaceae bacterium]
MTTGIDDAGARLLGTARKAVGLSGVISLLLGILILVWPGKTAAAVAVLFVIYAFIVGLDYLGTAAFGKVSSGWARVGYALLGVLFIVAAIVSLSNLGATTAVLGIVLGVTVGVLWIAEGVIRLAALGAAPSRGWAAFSAIISLLAGIMLLFSPLWGAAVLWLLLGISLVVIGIVQIVHAYKIGK